jgi:hypothetical protein
MTDYCPHGYATHKRCPQCGRPARRPRRAKRSVYDDHDLGVVGPDPTESDENRRERLLGAIGIPYRRKWTKIGEIRPRWR